MPAIILQIFRILGLAWGSLVRLMPFLGKLGPWLVGLLPMFSAFMRKVISWFGANTTEAILKGSAAMAIRLAVVTAWGILLAAVATGIAGLGIRDICFTNPFTGFPQAMMFLVASAFPIKFALGLMSSYIVFRATVFQATMVMSRTIKFLFGA